MRVATSVTDLPAATDIVVIGGGIVGASVAYELVTAGRDVVVVDPARPGRASDAGAGIASPQTNADPDPQWHEFGALAAAYLRELVERLRDDGADLGSEPLAECGSLVVALAEHEDPWFEQVAALATQRDPDVAEISATDAQTRFPVLCRPWRALFSPHSARVDGRGLTRALHAAIAGRGSPLVHTEVDKLTRLGDRVVSVSTAEGSIACEQVVLAAGAWSTALAAPLGVRLPVEPTKGEIVHLVQRPTGELSESGAWPIVQPVLNFYLVPWAQGRVACGGTFDPGAGFDVRPTAEGLRDLLRESLVIAPGLGAAEVVETRVGLRPTTPDDRPLLGPLRGTANVHLCTGHGANGLLLGPYSGALVAAWLVRGDVNALLPYDADRFGVA